MTKKLVLALVVLVMAFSATAALADTIEFSAIGTGSYTFPGTVGSAITGTSTLVSVREVLPNHGSPFMLVGTTLDFTSGLATSLGSTKTFASGGTISISGGLCGTGCFLGTFTDVQYDINNAIFGGAFIFGDVSPATWTMLGLAPAPTGARGSLTATLVPTGDGGGRIGSVDFSLTRVPEPASLALLGSAFLFAGGMMRRKIGL